ncbi:hydrogenase maturation protease [bacterium]|nr:hydrogenase maturation protease [bacterium]
MFVYDPKKPLLIIGFGNPLRSDDGAGVFAIEKLKKMKLPENVKLLDGGTMGIDTISVFENYSQVILIDCLRSDLTFEPIVEASLDEIILKPNELHFSAHELNLNSVLNLMKTLKLPIPNIFVYGINPESTSYGTELSSKAKNAVELVLKKIQKLLSLPKKRTLKSVVQKGVI